MAQTIYWVNVSHVHSARIALGVHTNYVHTHYTSECSYTMIVGYFRQPVVGPGWRYLARLAAQCWMRSKDLTSKGFHCQCPSLPLLAAQTQDIRTYGREHDRKETGGHGIQEIDT